ncbi:MAG: nitrogenase iron-molybdenum cofactor biosynthesis protein NifN [Ectothiorhodospira sp.]
MAEVTQRARPLSVGPLKASPPLGAALAMLGMDRSIPLLHGAQGCTAFAKVFLVQHFREPIPLQTTAMDQVSAVMGGDDHLQEALVTLCGKTRPALIGVLTTGLCETEGADVERVIRRFRADHPEFEDVAVVPVATPDFTGDAESGFARAVTALIDTLVPATDRAGASPRQVNVLAGPALTPGDVEALRDLIEAFGLEPLILPDLSASLDGHLETARLASTSTGGTPVEALQRMGESALTLVAGAALAPAADRLRALTGVPDLRLDTLMGLAAVDELLVALSRLSGCPVPARLRRERSRLQDAMLDSHFMLGFQRVAVAGEPDRVYALSRLIHEMGGEVVAAVATRRAPVLERVPAAQVRVGDLEDVEALARRGEAQCLIANAHGVETARRLGIPLLRAGYPQHDRLGGFQRTWIGYAGTRQTLFDLANLQLESAGHHEVSPYHPFHAHPPPEEPAHGTATPSAADAAARP